MYHQDSSQHQKTIQQEIQKTLFVGRWLRRRRRHRRRRRVWGVCFFTTTTATRRRSGRCRFCRRCCCFLWLGPVPAMYGAIAAA
jgi:hypothetical protein